MQRRPLLGLLGSSGIWITAGLALPLVNVLKEFSVAQLMVARGSLTALLAFILLRGGIFPVDRYALLAGLGFTGGCLGLYHGIREIGPSLTIIIITSTPIINFLIAWWKGKNVSSASVAGLLMIILGVVLALMPWEHVSRFTWQGICWSVFGTFSGALYFEALSKAQEDREINWSFRLRLCFWQAIIVLFVGGVGIVFSAHSTSLFRNTNTMMTLMGFAFVGGFLYFLSNIEAFAHLPIDAASVLSQGETPAVILGASILLGGSEKLSFMQWVGVFVALGGAFYLSRWLTKPRKEVLV